MKPDKILDAFAQTPVVAAVKDEKGLTACLGSNARVVFVLFGTVLTVESIVARIQNAGKIAIVHLDLIEGLAAREAAVDYIATATNAEGIISTKQPLLRRAKEKGLLAIRRFFLLDSMALQSLYKQLTPESADLIEVLPGVMPKVLQGIALNTSIPLIAGGLIADKDDVVQALSAGAVAVSSTNPVVWQL